MEIEAFKEELQKRRLPVLEHIDRTNETVQQLLQLRHSAKNINFQCDFDDTNHCKGGKHMYPHSDRGCCGSCAMRIGYQEIIIKSDLPRYACLYQKDIGYWRKGFGCILPHSMRSEICLTYACSHLQMEGTARTKIQQLYYKLHDLVSKLISINKEREGN